MHVTVATAWWWTVLSACFGKLMQNAYWLNTCTNIVSGNLETTLIELFKIDLADSTLAHVQNSPILRFQAQQLIPAISAPQLSYVNL